MPELTWIRGLQQMRLGSRVSLHRRPLIRHPLLQRAVPITIPQLNVHKCVQVLFPNHVPCNQIPQFLKREGLIRVDNA
jgi:hypothetical protein